MKTIYVPHFKLNLKFRSFLLICLLLWFNAAGILSLTELFVSNGKLFVKLQQNALKESSHSSLLFFLYTLYANSNILFETK